MLVSKGTNLVPLPQLGSRDATAGVLEYKLVGLALLVVGILYKVSFTKYTDAIPEDYSAIQYVPTLAIIVGAVVFFIAFLGCCGALRQNTCMLSWYGGILVLIFIAQIALGIFAFVKISNNDDFNSKIAHQIDILFSKYKQGQTGIVETVDFIQSNLKCCGTTSKDFWGSEIPKSCYPDNDTSKSAFQDGCSKKVPELLLSSVKLIAIVALAISVTEVVGAILALCLAGCIKEKRRQFLSQKY